MNEIYFAVGAGIVVIAIFLIAWRYERIRNREIKRQARILGYDYAEEDADLLANVLPKLHLLGQGHSRKVRHRLRSESGGGLTVFFDFRYRTGGGQHSSNHQQSVVAFRDPTMSLPAFELRPENVFHRIGSALGYQDIDFPSHPDFSRRYLLRGEDETAVRKLFSAPIVRFFARRKGWSVEGGGEWLIVYRHRRRVRPADLRRFFKDTEEIKRVFGGE
jgi:hypothetical protein